MPESTPRWDDLRIFLAVVEKGGPQPAGRALGLTAAKVGQRIAALEEALGKPLFLRRARDSTLSVAGKRLLDQAQSMEALAAQVSETLAEPTDRLAGTVRIGAPDGVSNYLIAEACDALSRDHPALQVQVVVVPRMFSLSNREADLVVTVAPPDASRLTVRKIADYRLHLYARADVIEALGPVRTLADLDSMRGIGYVSDMIFDKELDYYALLGREREPALTSNSLLMQLRWCLRGAGLCILPEFVGREHPELRVVLPGELSLRRAFYLVRHQDNARVPRINRIADVVCSRMAAMLDLPPP